MIKLKKIPIIALGIVLMFGMAGHANSATDIDLNSASGFGVMAGAAVSDSATASNIAGSVGLSPAGGTNITQLSCSDITGTIYDTNAGYTGGHDANTDCLVTDATLLTAAKADVSLAYNNALNQATTDLITADLGGQTLTPGVYEDNGAPNSLSITGVLTLDAEGDTDAVFIFKSGSTLTTSVNSEVRLINGAKSSNVFWQVGSSATLGAGSTFNGNIMAAVSITDDGGSTINGRLLADADNTDADSTGAVTLNNTTVVVPATLNVIKNVVNSDGGTATSSDFTISVTGTNVSPSSFAGSESGVEVTLDPGSYEVTETAGPSGYIATGSGDCSGTIEAGETKTCTITNNDIAPQLTVNKVVINDDGGTKTISDFPLFLNGVSITSGVATTTTIGSHTVSETTDPDYTATIGGDCAADGTITLALGDVKTCTITNDDIAPPTGGGGSTTPVPPIIDIVKRPNPLSLPDGSGEVEYTYTLTNIGTVPVSSITLVGDSCSPLSFVSGDVNNDDRLDVDETWIYTCSTTLTETHTNIVTATGWANGVSTSDTANATVVVGVPVVPPIINVTKVPSSSLLSSDGGVVEYTYKITNPGEVALSNVLIGDDKCDPVTFVSGDVNNNDRLDVDETWTYTCSTNITSNTVNTVNVSGEANNLIARDSAIATVIVSDAIEPIVDPDPVAPAPVVPALPDTGLPPSESNTPWNVIVSIGVLAMLASLYFVRRRQTA